jgi:hypothetical protein
MVVKLLMRFQTFVVFWMAKSDRWMMTPMLSHLTMCSTMHMKEMATKLWLPLLSNLKQVVSTFFFLM